MYFFKNDQSIPKQRTFSILTVSFSLPPTKNSVLCKIKNTLVKNISDSYLSMN